MAASEIRRLPIPVVAAAAVLPDLTEMEITELLAAAALAVPQASLVGPATPAILRPAPTARSSAPTAQVRSLVRAAEEREAAQHLTPAALQAATAVFMVPVVGEGAEVVAPPEDRLGGLAEMLHKDFSLIPTSPSLAAISATS